MTDEKLYPLPKGWQWVMIKDIAEVITGSTPSKKNLAYYGGNFPFFKPADLNSGRHVFKATEYLSEEGKKVSRIIPPNSIGVCCIGSIGKCGYFEVEGTTNQQINSVIPKINPLYVYYYFLSDKFINELLSKASATTISIVNKSKMESCKIPLPPLDEQQRIVNLLDELFADLNEAKALAQGIVDGSELRRAAILHRAFTGELSKLWRDEHGTALNDWQQCHLSKLLLPMQTKRPTGKIFRYIDIDSIDNDRQSVKAPKIIATSEAPSRASRAVESGNVLFSMVRPYLKNVAFIDESLKDCIASTGFFVCKCKANLLPEFLYRFLCFDGTISYLTQFMKGDNSPAIRQNEFLDTPINLPPPEEQKEIVRVLDDLLGREQRTTKLATKTLEHIELIKKSILARAFRGELATD